MQVLGLGFPAQRKQEGNWKGWVARGYPNVLIFYSEKEISSMKKGRLSSGL